MISRRTAREPADKQQAEFKDDLKVLLYSLEESLTALEHNGVDVCLRALRTLTVSVSYNMLQFNQAGIDNDIFLILILLISLIFSLILGQNMVDSAADKELVYAEFHRMKVVAFLVSCEVPGGSQ